MNIAKLHSLVHTAASVLVAASFIPHGLGAQVTVNSAPVGVMAVNAATGDTGLAFPLIAEDVFVGIVSGNAGSSVQFPPESGSIAAVLSAGVRYYAEVQTGPLEGERLDVDTAATLAVGGSAVVLDLGASSHSTLPSVADNVLAGARVVLRPHVTLAGVQAMFTPALIGNDHFNFADGILIHSPGGYVLHHLKADGVTWVEKGGAVDVRDRIIPPDVSVQLRIKSGSKQWVHTGNVRVNDFRKNLIAGVQALATGFPMDLTPAQIGGFVDPFAPAGVRWTASSDMELADWVQNSTGGPMPRSRAFLAADGSTWRRVNNSTNLASQPILGATDASLLRRINPDSGYFIERPFTP